MRPSHPFHRPWKSPKSGDYHIPTARRRLGFMMTIQLCTADDIRALQQQIRRTMTTRSAPTILPKYPLAITVVNVSAVPCVWDPESCP